MLPNQNLYRQSILTIVFLLISSIASTKLEAATAKKVKRNKSSQTILYGGATANYNLYMPCFDDTALSCETNGIGYRAFFGYQFSGDTTSKASLKKRRTNKKQTAFRIETGLASYGGTKTIGAVNQETSVMGLDVALSYNTLLNKGKYNLYGKLGAGFNIVDIIVESNPSAVSAAVLSITPSIGFGFEYYVLPYLAIRTEYSFIYGVAANSGYGQANINMLQLGVAYFSNPPIMQKGRKSKRSKRRR